MKRAVTKAGVSISGLGRLAACALVIAIAAPAQAGAPSVPGVTFPEVKGPWPGVMADEWPLGLLQAENLAIPRPKAPVDFTGTWQLRMVPETGGFNFTPIPKLTPAAQALYDAGVKANAEGKAFRDDTGACWPAGMPKWWTRVWPIQFMQYPTGLVMIQGLLNPVRWVYLDGRGHMDPDLRVGTFQGESIGRWEGDTLVVHTDGFGGRRHWVQTGIPVSDQLQIVERIRMAPDRQSITVELTMTDPVNWVGEWKNTKIFNAVKGGDVKESHCLPDLNDHIAGTRLEDDVRTPDDE